MLCDREIKDVAGFREWETVKTKYVVWNSERINKNKTVII